MALISRRDVFRIAGGSMAASTTVVPSAAQPSAPPDGIDPITIKRRGVGFRGMDKARAHPGFTLFAPMAATNRTVYLIDMSRARFLGCRETTGNLSRSSVPLFLLSLMSP